MALTKALSKELGADGIRVNAVLIGLVESGQWERVAGQQGGDGGSLPADGWRRRHTAGARRAGRGVRRRRDLPAVPASVVHLGDRPEPRRRSLHGVLRVHRRRPGARWLQCRRRRRKPPDTGERAHAGHHHRRRQLPVDPRAPGRPAEHAVPPRHPPGAGGHRPRPAAQDGGPGRQGERGARCRGDGEHDHRPASGPRRCRLRHRDHLDRRLRHHGRRPRRARPATASASRSATGSGRAGSTAPCATCRCWSGSPATWSRSAPTPGCSTSPTR